MIDRYIKQEHANTAFPRLRDKELLFHTPQKVIKSFMSFLAACHCDIAYIPHLFA